jgi:hypothetical protein
MQEGSKYKQTNNKIIFLFGMPGEDITVHVTVYLNRGDRPGGWSLIRLAWIDESGNPVGW